MHFKTQNIKINLYERLYKNKISNNIKTKKINLSKFALLISAKFKIQKKDYHIFRVLNLFKSFLDIHLLKNRLKIT